MATNKGGRPPKQIDQRQFETLCSYQCTQAEICGFFQVTDKTLSGWCRRTYGEGFSEVYKKKAMGGKISLRRLQFKHAEKSPAMAIFLGKQYLGQKDFVEGGGALSVQIIDDIPKGKPSRQNSPVSAEQGKDGEVAAKEEEAAVGDPEREK